jgi:hypothetical protein
VSEKGKFAELAIVTSRLVDLMDAEVACLRQGLARNLTGMQQEKLQLVAAYEAALAELRANPALFASIAPAFKEELVEASRRLERAIERNANALQAARDVNSRLMDSIVKAATADQVQTRGYGRTGLTARPAAPARNEAISIALDRRL